MSDLEAKFTELEAQLTTQHSEMVTLLESIAAALGTPPPTPTATLDDVVTAIGATNTLLTAIHSDMNSYLLSIFNTLDTINNNASLNSQRILNTLLQTSCPCDSTVPLLPADLDTTPTSAADVAKCQRIQYFIDLFAGWVILVGVYVGETGSISSFQVDNLLAIHVGEVGITTGQIADPIPTAVRDSIVGKITSAVSSEGASSVNYGLFTAMTNADNLEGMRQSLYGVTNADAGRASLDDMLDSLVGMVEPYLSIIRTMFYSAWLNDIYSDVPIVDASAYDGTICTGPSIPEITDCTEYTTADYVISGGTFQSIQKPPMSSSYPWALAGDFFGFTVRIVAPDPGGGPGGVYSIYGGVEHLLFTIDLGEGPKTIGEHTTVLSIRTHVSEFQSAHWTVEICPPS